MEDFRVCWRDDNFKAYNKGSNEFKLACLLGIVTPTRGTEYITLAKLFVSDIWQKRKEIMEQEGEVETGLDQEE